MKKIGWSILIGLLAIVSLNAQETVHDNKKEENTFTLKSIIKVFPLNALTGEIGIGYERAIKPKASLNFILTQGFNKQSFYNSLSERSYYLFFEIGVRRYLSKRKKAPEGWFASGALFAEYININFNNESKNNDIERIQGGISGKIGHQWILKNALKGMAIEVAGGLEYGTFTIFNSVIDFTVGYSW
ncbi:DUF3575 domain-containing protein [Flavivirga amylovorans]|uniref:DUF3575 domain-containing protein n=1 Tax=Flavivirga amylovorans TaxID=870486 RepID=A0ABT8X1I4_9FLAO|nr:DUF3575 domain-containing protein [Flavivirga amylovorans]MDO5987811.1 DUF3575 domain-containing protein [Flavivirga amylovorans]